MVNRLQPIRIKLADTLSTIYKYTAKRFKCRLQTCLQQKTKWPPTVASTTNWITRVDQATRTRLVLHPVIQAYSVTPIFTYRSKIITSLTTPAVTDPSLHISSPTHLTPSPCIITLWLVITTHDHRSILQYLLTRYIYIYIYTYNFL